MKLLIAIPALNEEDSIQSIITRSLAARSHILSHSPVTQVDITVVSDGSTDRTVEFASKFADQIHLIVFERNRGYGAAIKEAWEQSDADLLGFLDADGTCSTSTGSVWGRSRVRSKVTHVTGFSPLETFNSSCVKRPCPQPSSKTVCVGSRCTL